LETVKEEEQQSPNKKDQPTNKPTHQQINQPNPTNPTQPTNPTNPTNPPN
jgi:hypothetical protein